MVIFRENTEDIYAGIEFEAGHARTTRSSWRCSEAGLPQGLRQDPLPGELRASASSPSRRRARSACSAAAIEYAIANKRKSVTIVHKGNILKFTEGAFRNWGYALAEREFAAQTYTWEQWERTKAAKGEKAANAEMDARQEPARSSSRTRSPTSRCSRC